ncbi:DUF6414 family protein [Jiangella alkaliphila]|uniref:Uncharacterized protein n=1 Tax=Jiangella alkaliphila TaxID=419479 RepID=A0A1H2GF37_9ACTN|nr:hypothetical protein [Jiangella alkaliphila]SDU18092.1 hypothetical protein SAMN04488563_0458 [Jiangella alkaliphila]
MVLREFLYLDIDKVRGLAAQLYEGVVESTTESSDDGKETGVGVGPLKYGRRWGSTAVLQKSMADALFPTLESDLEAEGVLRDASADLADNRGWVNLRNTAPVGSLIRLSGQAALFDARYFASVLSNMVVVGQGVGEVTGASATGDQSHQQGLPPKAKPPAQKRAERDARRGEGLANAPELLESLIPPGPIPLLGDSVTREQIVGMVKIARGVFTPGLHLTMYCAGIDGPPISARLEEGRRFLDSEPDVLFQRYGVAPLDWTLVGIVGHHGAKPPSSQFPSLTEPDGQTVSRGRTAAGLNQFISFIANLGFADLPRDPGFSIVPLAVYRVLGGSDLPPAAEG